MSERGNTTSKSTDTEEVCVHILHAPPDDAFSLLIDLLDSNIHVTTGSETVESHTEILVAGRPTHDHLRTCTSLKALIIPYAGVPAETRNLVMDSYPDLPVYNLHHNAVAASEMAMALFLAAAKTLIPVDRKFRTHDWRSRYDGAPTMLLEGKTAVILGFGAIGSRLATMCIALGMNVHAVRRHVGQPRPGSIHLHSLEDLHELLPSADALFIALPLTLRTEGLIGKREMDLLPTSCVLVNIARGAIVDEESLYLALKDDRIAAAGIDVWYSYPRTPESRANTPPSRFPFHELDNVAMSPHRGGAFRLQELERRRMADLACTLNAFARGEDTPHRVDIRAGY